MITSSANARVKAARGLRDRKARQESGLCLAEGIRLVAEAHACGAAIEGTISPAFTQHIASTDRKAAAEVQVHESVKVLPVWLHANPQGLPVIANVGLIQLRYKFIRRTMGKLKNAADPKLAICGRLTDRRLVSADWPLLIL